LCTVLRRSARCSERMDLGMADAAVAQVADKALVVCHCLNHGVAGALRDTGSQLIMICQGQDLRTA